MNIRYLVGNAEDKTLSLLHEFYKYKVMWQLRSIEEEIIKEDGTITIEWSPDETKVKAIKFEGFSEGLETVISEKLSEIQFHV